MTMSEPINDESRQNREILTFGSKIGPVGPPSAKLTEPHSSEELLNRAISPLERVAALLTTSQPKRFQTHQIARQMPWCRLTLFG
jgi:hypothetical protein